MSFLTIVTFSVLALASPGNECLIDNLDLSQGQKGWNAIGGGGRHAWRLEASGGREGRPAFRVDAEMPQRRLILVTTTDRLKPDGRYLFEIWWRTKGVAPDSWLDAYINCEDAKGNGLMAQGLPRKPDRVVGEWTCCQYPIDIPANTAKVTLGVIINGTVGTIWFGDMSLKPYAPQRTFDSMYDFDPFQVLANGRAAVPLTNFNRLLAGKSPFLVRAKRWNELLVATAYWQEDFARARRAIYYRQGGDQMLQEHSEKLTNSLKALDQLQKTYGRLYVEHREADLPKLFDVEAEKLGRQIHDGSADLQKFVTDKITPAAGSWFEVPKAPLDQPWWDAAKHCPRYILWNRWSEIGFHDMETPLNLGNCQTLYQGAPAKVVDGKADWSNYDAERSALQKVGMQRFSLITHYSMAAFGYLAPEFASRHANDKDLRMWNAEGKPAGNESGLTCLNWLNPAAKAHMVDILTQMATHFKDKPEHQFYVSSWECSGPYAAGVRIGLNPSHKTAFREYLKDRYRTIEALNAAWGAKYANFDAIEPAPKQDVPVGDGGSPLILESERWAQEAYVDYLSTITKTIRSVDPSKPVLGQHSGLLDCVINPRVVDSVDIIGYHFFARTTTAVQVWLSSLQRYTGRPTGLFENFWGAQEDHAHPERMAEESVMRAQLRRYLFRHAAWGRCIQTWWAAYAGVPYVLCYNGYWFNVAYDLTTLRYCAAGLPVEKAKAERFGPLLLGSEIVPSRILIVQPYSTMLAQGPSSAAWQEWQDWHRLLFSRNLLYEVLPDTWLAEGRGRLSDFDVVILPVATHLDQRFSKQLTEYLRQGGMAIASGPAGLYDELGRADGSLFAAATPKPVVKRLNKPDESWNYDYGIPSTAKGGCETAVGQGKLILLPKCLAKSTDRKNDLIDLIRQRTVPNVEAPNTTLELLLRRVDGNRHLLCVINRDPDRAAKGDVFVRGDYSQVVDVDQTVPCAVPVHRDQQRTRFSTRLGPGETAYYLLLDSK